MRTSQITYLLVVILGLSCKPTSKNSTNAETDSLTSQRDSIWNAERLNIKATYEPLILFESGHPIFTIGQPLNSVDSTLSYRMDPNGDFQDYFPLVRDYLTTDDDLGLFKIGDHSHIGAIVYFSADELEQRIFNVAGYWSFEVRDDNILPAMKEWVVTTIFPTLKQEFEFRNGWTFERVNLNQLERLALKQDSTFWTLTYKVELK